MSYDASRDALNAYNLLCTVKPKFRESKYPYNPWSDAKVERTMHELELYQISQGVFSTRAPPPTHGGDEGEDTKKITIFVITHDS